MRTAALTAIVTIAPALAIAEPHPWFERGTVPLAEGRSVAIVRKDEALFQHPGPHATRRGSAALGARLPIFGTRRGAGCKSRWFLVGPSAWVCGDHVHVAQDPPITPRSEPEQSESGLPFEYYFVGTDGSLGYEKFSLAEEGIPDSELQPGFIIALVQRAAKATGDPFGLTTKGFWVPMRDLAAARPSSFVGAEIGDRLDVAWVKVDSARVHEKAGGRVSKDLRFERQTELHVRRTAKVGGVDWVEISDSRWIRRSELNVATPATAPEDLRPGERWIDIDLSEQVLTAYEGKHPVFATLVSSGKGRGTDLEATPKGIFRIWVKLRTSDMTNLEDEDASRYYSIEEVPWVMFFHEGYGLHGAFWHRSFGRVRSHGCVNLAPRDALRLFYWTGPRLPAGWTAALPTDTDVGTLVHVR